MVQAATVELSTQEPAPRADDLFEVDVESRSALDAFELPYASAAASGVGFRQRSRAGLRPMVDPKPPSPGRTSGKRSMVS